MMILEVFWKSTVVLGAALCICALLRRKSADVRKLILSIAVVAMFVAAALWPLLPRWTAVTPSWLAFRQPPAAATQQQWRAPARINDAPEFAAAEVRPRRAHSASGGIDFRPWILPMIWFAGAAILVVRFAINLRGLRRLRKASEPVIGQQLPVRLWRNESIPAPVTWGIFRPIVLVPAGFEDLPAEARDAVLCHELAHIQAHDFLMRGFAEIARALLWFQPLLWIVRRQLREEQELACDNRVLASGGKPSAYAKLLLDWDARPGMDYLVAVGIANRSCLKRRLYALLDPDQRREPVAGATAAGTWFVGLAMATGLAALGFAQAIPARRVIAVPKAPVQIAQVQIGQAQAPAPQPAAGGAQAPAPKFDAISIQPCQPGDGPGRSGTGDLGANGGVDPNAPEGIGGYFRASPGRLDVTCGSVLTMIEWAYIANAAPLLNNPGLLRPAGEQVRGVPQWALPARYTIHAVTGDPVANGPTDAGPGRGPLPAAMLLYSRMLQSLLEDRFQLKTHREVEEAPMYALAVAPSGFKLKPMQDGDCTPHAPGSGMFFIPGADDKPYCGWVGWPIHGPNRTLLGGGITMGRLAQSMAMFVLDRNVIDRTGIAGSFIIRLEFTSDTNTRCLSQDMCAIDPNSNIPPAATIFIAAEEQLGLKLEAIQGPREHIVIDRVERPAEN